jgi:hypothetical protein
MKQITKYAAADGAEFTSADACIAYEALVAEIAEIMRTLPARPRDDGCRFSNGHGCIQHDPAQLAVVRVALLRIGLRYVGDHPNSPKWLQQSIDDPTVHPGWAGRLMDDAAPRPLSAAWYRFMCIDGQGREWGQPYYADHPDQADSQEVIAGAAS